MATTVFCLVPNRAIAGTVVDKLRALGMSGSDVSVISPHQSPSSGMEHVMHTEAPVGAVAGISAGGFLGASIGWLIGMGTLAIPGIGSVIAAGPILAILSGAAIGATTGGVAGALVGHGIPHVEAKRYEMKVRDGNTMISVHAIDDDEAERVKTLFMEWGGEHISSSASPRQITAMHARRAASHSAHG